MHISVPVGINVTAEYIGCDQSSGKEKDMSDRTRDERKQTLQVPKVLYSGVVDMTGKKIYGEAGVRPGANCEVDERADSGAVGRMVSWMQKFVPRMGSTKINDGW